MLANVTINSRAIDVINAIVIAIISPLDRYMLLSPYKIIVDL